MAAFVFAQIKFFGSAMLMSYITMGLLFPAATASCLCSSRCAISGCFDSYFGVVLPQVAFALAMSILCCGVSSRTFRMNFSKQPESTAAYIEFFRYVTLPLSRPILATVGTIVFVQQLELVI